MKRIFFCIAFFLLALSFVFSDTDDSATDKTIASEELIPIENDTDENLFEGKTVEEASSESVANKISEIDNWTAETDISNAPVVVLIPEEIGFSGNELDTLAGSVYSVFVQDFSNTTTLNVLTDEALESETRSVLLMSHSDSDTEAARSALLEKVQYAIVLTIKKQSVKYTISAMFIDLKSTRIIASVRTKAYSESSKLYKHSGATDELIDLLCDRLSLEQKSDYSATPDEKEVARVSEITKAKRPKKTIQDYISFKQKHGVYPSIGSAKNKYITGVNLGADVYFLSGKYWFAGADANMLYMKLTDDYNSGAKHDSVTFINADFVFGSSVCLLNFFRPYIATGLGLYEAVMESDSFAGFAMEGIAGIDLMFGKKFVLGGEYKLKYYAGSGFIDTFSVSFGRNF